MTDNDKQVAESELTHWNGRLAALMDEISDLEAIRDPEPYQDRRLNELKIEERSVSNTIRELESRI
jgi:hypothetical protein